MSTVTWSDKVDVSTYTDVCEAGYSAGMQPPTLTGARRAFSEPARGNAPFAMCAAPEVIPWDDSKRRLPLNSPTGVSPAAKKIMRWSQADDQVLLNDLMPEMPGSSANPPHVHPEDNLSEASDDTARNNAMDYFDFGGSPRHKEVPQYYDRAGFVACEPTVDRESSLKKEVPMWTVEEDLLILQLVEQHGKRWSKIAAHLPGRTDNGVRNRWNRMEKAQTLRHRHGAEHGYRCRRCGQPKRGHICAALTQGDMPEGDNLAIKAAELTALSAQRMQAMLAEKHAGGRGMPPMRSSRSMPNHRLAPMPGSAEPLKALALSPLKKAPTAPPPPAGKAPLGKPQVEPLVEMDEVQLDDFLTELHLSLATPTNADRMQHAAAMAAGQHAASMAAAGHHAAALMAGQRAAAMAAGFHGSLPSPMQSVPTMPPPSAHRYHSQFAGAPAACISAASGSAAPAAAGPSAMAHLSPASFFYAHHGSPATGHFLSRGGSADTCGDSEDLVASMLLYEPAILPQPSTDTMLANALPAVSLAGSFGNRGSHGEDVPMTNSQRGNSLNKPKLSIEC